MPSKVYKKNVDKCLKICYNKEKGKGDIDYGIQGNDLQRRKEIW